mgnify:CR=1 FL=1
MKYVSTMGRNGAMREMLRKATQPAPKPWVARVVAAVLGMVR